MTTDSFTGDGRREAAPHPMVGRRVRLVWCGDEFTELEPGQLGTVILVDGLGTVHVRWDDGHQLGLIQGVDQWVEVVKLGRPDPADVEFRRQVGREFS